MEHTEQTITERRRYDLVLKRIELLEKSLTKTVKKSKNNDLLAAKRGQNDEFYTSIEVINAELQHYTKHFENKVIFCNCDDPEWSNFYKFLSMKQKQWKIKKLIFTHFEKEKQHSYALILDKNGNKTRIELNGNGDFRSEECVEFLKQADIVITNPPFSLFREYIALLMKHNKKFLVIGNLNAISYKEITEIKIGKNKEIIFFLQTKPLLKIYPVMQGYDEILNVWRKNL